jgi:nicotinic acetylcholine receptor
MPNQYGGIDVVEIPSSHIWVPDIVLYNNADGTYEVNTITKAHVVSIYLCFFDTKSLF